MKQRLAFLFFIAFLFALTGCGAKNAEKEIFKLVDQNYDALVKACEEKDADALLAISGVKQVNIVDEYVIVYCNGAGIAPSSQDYGFYYSADNSPIAVDCNLNIVRRAEDLAPEGKGFQCVMNCNTFYTQLIKGNIYFYRNAY